ncbi:hypothetical protein TorRG33x02_212260 [Trema orientale]|uniref:Uncharacterized protein n=1 Tax=Trema orientale TaxID=63057 RepID=A0A2P5EBY1_TREOI|nr:hypothetical protein TorRG33x02_212260 [Trema orientale]
MGRRDSPQAPPVVPVRSEAHGTVEEELVGRLLDGSIREIGAVEKLLRRLGVARDDETGQPDRECHQWSRSKALGELGEEPVSQRPITESENQTEERETRRPRNGGSGMAAVATNPRLGQSPSQSSRGKPEPEDGDEEKGTE